MLNSMHKAFAITWIFCFFFCFTEEKLYLDFEDNSLSELYNSLDTVAMNEIIEASIQGLETYVYSDIILNPPNDTYFPKVNITQELLNINISEGRPFYDFYRDYRKALNKIKDKNLLIFPVTINLGNEIHISQYQICLPFSLRMDYDENKEIKIFIKEYSDCSKYYSESERAWIKGHENIFLDKINGEDAFEFIQNFGKEFYDTKNSHARFSYILRKIHIIPLYLVPFEIEEFSNFTFTFGNDDDTLKIDYHLMKPNTVFNEEESELVDKEEFNDFFQSENEKEKG